MERKTNLSLLNRAYHPFKCRSPKSIDDQFIGSTISKT